MSRADSKEKGIEGEGWLLPHAPSFYQVRLLLSAPVTEDSLLLECPMQNGALTSSTQLKLCFYMYMLPLQDFSKDEGLSDTPRPLTELGT